MTATPSATFVDHAKTKQPVRRRLFLLAMSFAVIMIASACGEDGGGGTFEEYFADVSRITGEADKRIQELASDFSGGFDSLEAAKEVYPAYVAAYEDFVEGIDGLNPPPQAAEAHRAFVVTSKELQELNKARLESLNAAQEDSALEEIFGADEEYSAAVKRQNDACIALRKVAEGRGVSVPGLANCEET
jgi:hypothetical protein